MKNLIITCVLLFINFGAFSIPIQIANSTPDRVYVWIRWNTSMGADCTGFWSMHCINPYETEIYDPGPASNRPVAARVWSNDSCTNTGPESVQANPYYSCSAATVVSPYTLYWNQHGFPSITSFGLTIVL